MGSGLADAANFLAMVSSFKTACGSKSSLRPGRRLSVRLLCAIVQSAHYKLSSIGDAAPSRPDPGRNSSPRLYEENGRCQAKTLSICAPAHRASPGIGDNRMREELQCTEPASYPASPASCETGARLPPTDRPSCWASPASTAS